MKYFLLGDKGLIQSFMFLFQGVLEGDFVPISSFSNSRLLPDCHSKKDLFVICAYDYRSIEQELIEKGLLYDTHYKFAHDLFSLLSFPLKNYAAGREIVACGHLKYRSSIELKYGVLINDEVLPTALEAALSIPKSKYFIVSGPLYYRFRDIFQKHGLTEYCDYASETFLKYAECSNLLNKVFYAQRKYTEFVCSRPFKMISVSAKECTVCCGGRMPFSIGNLNEQSWESIWYSLRRKIACVSALNGSYVFCNEHYCPYLSVNKQLVISKLERSAIDSIAKVEDKTFDMPPKRVWLEFDRSCNLACPSCRRQHRTLSERENTIASHIAEIVLEKIIPTAERIECAGYGEALFSKHYLKILRSPLSKTKSLHLLSNGLLLTRSVWEELLKDFASIQIEISVDAASEETYKIVRNGDFTTLTENLVFIGKLREANLVSKFIINMTVSQKNIKELTAFVRMGKELHVDQVKLSAIHNWRWTPSEFKEYTITDPDGTIQPYFDHYFSSPELSDSIVYDNNIGFKNEGEKCTIKGER